MKLHSSHLTLQSGYIKQGLFYKVYHVSTKNINDNFKDQLLNAKDSKIFEAESGQQYIDHIEKIIYIGLGDLEKITLRKLASFYIKLGEQLIKWKNVGLEIYLNNELISKLPIFSIVYQISNSLEIGAFPVDSLSKTYRERKIQVGTIGFVSEEKGHEKEIQAAIHKSSIVSRYLNGARYIEHLPANHFTPEEFAKRSSEIAKSNNLKITIYDETKLKKEKFGGILAVSQGSDKKPKMIILEYTPKNAVTDKKIAFIGKGLTFDSGGISIKPSGDMHEMKYDMCGAATVIHAIGAIAEMGLKVPVIAAIGAVENMPDAQALKPGDVYTAYNGVTVEVQNTDAEGRLVLGDVLSYIDKKYKPEYMIDLATLTGAVIIALGHEAAGLMSNNEELTDLIKEASTSSEDRIWELPLWEEYGEDLKSDIADIRNITGGGRGGGTLSAAQFLIKFVDPKTKWAHIDIAGTAWRSKPSGTQTNGPTGYGVRLLVDLVENIEKRKSKKTK
jgi:leucyl aminopeptidase